MQALQTAPSSRVRGHGLPVVTRLPGLAGDEWPDDVLLRFICGVLFRSQDKLRAKIAPRIKDPRLKVELQEALLIALYVSGVARNDELGKDGKLRFKSMPGLAAESVRELREVLDAVCNVMNSLRREISAVFIQRDDVDRIEALSWAQALAVGEGVLSRAGYETDYDKAADGQLTPLELQALVATSMAADEGMAEECECRCHRKRVSKLAGRRS